MWIVAIEEIGGVAAQPQILPAKFLGRDLARAVTPRLELGDPFPADIESPDVQARAGKGGGQGQAHIAEADDAETGFRRA